MPRLAAVRKAGTPEPSSVRCWVCWAYRPETLPTCTQPPDLAHVLTLSMLLVYCLILGFTPLDKLFFFSFPNGRSFFCFTPPPFKTYFLPLSFDFLDSNQTPLIQAHLFYVSSLAFFSLRCAVTKAGSQKVASQKVVPHVQGNLSDSFYWNDGNQHSTKTIL